MVQSIEGVYRNGTVELLEAAPSVEEARVIVTFLQPEGPVDLESRQIGPEQAEALRARLKSFEEDWPLPEMDAYDAL